MSPASDCIFDHEKEAHVPICSDCNEWFADADEEIEMPAEMDEIVDLIAEAARVSPHARSAYLRLRDLYRGLPLLEQRQILIADRMKDVA